MADISIHTAHSQDTDVEKSDVVGSNINKALSTKIKLRQRLVRIEHHLKFLLKIYRRKKTPRGLRIQKEIRLIDSPGSHHTKTTIQKIFIDAKQEVVGALIDY